jgi:hypothetical protein
VTSVVDPEVVSLPASETDRIDPIPDVIRLQSGTKARMVPLRMRQMFRLMRIITRGGAQFIPMLREAFVSAKDDDSAAEAFGTQLLAVMLIALPEAEDEAVEFVQSVVEPADLIIRNDKQAREFNENARKSLDAELYNPHPDDLITVVEAVILTNKEDLVALGKRLGAMLKIALVTGQSPDVKVPQGSSELTQTSSDRSPEPLTSSPQSTDGLTMSSLTYPSGE